MSNTILQFEDRILTVAEMAEEAGVTPRTINNVLADHPELEVKEVRQETGRPTKGLSETSFRNCLMPILSQNRLRQGNENGVSLFNLDLSSILISNPSDLADEELRAMADKGMQCIAEICNRLSKANQKLEEQNDRLLTRVDENRTWWTVVKILTTIDVPFKQKSVMPGGSASVFGKKLRQLSLEMGYEVRECDAAVNSHVDTQGSYHIDVVRKAFEMMSLKFPY